MSANRAGDKVCLVISLISKYNVFVKHDNTLTLIARIKENADSYIIQEMNKLGMEGVVTSHGAILFALFRSAELTMTEIAERIHRDRATVTALIKKLIKHGYVGTKTNDEDKRSSLVFLTEKGKDLERGFFKISEKVYSIQYAGITDEERVIFRQVLQQMNDNFNCEN